MWKKVFLLLGFCLAVFSLTLLAWSYIPSNKQVDVQMLLPGNMSVKSTNASPPAILEGRQVKMEWSESMRIGEEGIVRLDFQEI